MPRIIENTQNLNMVEVNGVEPMTSCVQGRRSPN
jgi:Asp-tRNA(Asn)/Glu-tRNA(Gln) amidotransferase C subunit